MKTRAAALCLALALGTPAFAQEIEDGGTGKVVINSHAPGDKGPQNIGFPSEPHEIAHFMAMLDKTSKKLTAEDKATLRKTLEEEKAKTDKGRAGH